jgi:DNA mismatch repair protein MutS2
MTESTLQKNNYTALGFDFIIDQLNQNIQLAITKKRLEQLLNIPLTQLEAELELTLAFKFVADKGFSFGIEINRDLFDILSKTSIDGAVLLTDELNEIKIALSILTQLKNFGKKEFKHDTDNKFALFCANLETNTHIFRLLDDTLDENGNVKDDASPALKELRIKIQKTQNYLSKRVQVILLGAIKNGMAREDALPTISNGRVVIPLRSENKRLLGGVSHGESGTGQTAYVEPKELFEHNNQLQEMLEDERAEIRKILLQLVTFIGADQESLALSFEQLVQFDFYQAKGKLAAKLKANKPIIKFNFSLKIEQAYNPILVLKIGHKETMPFDLSLDQENRILLLTGPNAGGKSILLKSTGLLQLMVQHGLLIPASENSEFSVFDQLFIDIGDNQSIDNELSTYSAHLSKMKTILSHATEKSLVLADEFGTGTEPDYGASLAEAILAELNERKIKGIFTTHYNNLKALAEKTTGIFNGAMLFNMTSLQPTFRFQAGSPGSSFAFEIAKNLGLSPQLIANAQKNIGKTRLNYDQSLLELQDKTRVLLDELASLKRKEKNLNELKESYQELKDNLDKRKDIIANEAEKKALEMLQNTQLELRLLKDNFQKSQTEAKKEIKQELETKTDTLAKKIGYSYKNERQPIIGSKVKHRIKGFEGDIISIFGDTAKISNNGFEWKSKLDELMVLNADDIKKKSYSSSNVTKHLLEKRTHFSQDLDLRGERTEDALKHTDLFINEALMLGFDRVRIIHGKGEGILRQMIRNQLKGMANVLSIADEHVEFGGAGITVLELGS